MYSDSLGGVGFGISDMYILDVNHINLLFLPLYYHIIQQLTAHCVILSSHTDAIMWISIYLYKDH
jgi:hypothetical protein